MSVRSPVPGPRDLAAGSIITATVVPSDVSKRRSVIATDWLVKRSCRPARPPSTAGRRCLGSPPATTTRVRAMLPAGPKCSQAEPDFQRGHRRQGYRGRFPFAMKEQKTDAQHGKQFEPGGRPSRMPPLTSPPGNARSRPKSMSQTMSTWKLPIAMPSNTSGIASSPAASVAWRGRRLPAEFPGGLVAIDSTDSAVHPTSIRSQIVRSSPSQAAQFRPYQSTATTEIGSERRRSRARRPMASNARASNRGRACPCSRISGPHRRTRPGQVRC